MMHLARSTRILLCTAIALLGACSSATEPVVPTLDFDAAEARWATSHPSSYSFDYISYSAMLPTQGFFRVDVTNGSVVRVMSYSTGAFVATTAGFTIDDLWARIKQAKSAGETLSELRFSVDGVPLDAMIGSFANDGGVRYQLRNYVPHP
jgi:hypothetical protein